jgi:hypothetical protein
MDQPDAHTFFSHVCATIKKKILMVEFSEEKYRVPMGFFSEALLVRTCLAMGD